MCHDLAKHGEARQRLAVLDDLLYEIHCGRVLPWAKNELLALDVGELRKISEVVLGKRRDGKRSEEGFDWAQPSFPR